MHAIKGGWVGQTFALGKCNESGGKKSRIRRSKEERKAMVETYIKRYQGLNNGSFPSLNLTHKEVGGSFYTVRQIVREIIQENRVLGPAKLTPELQNIDEFLEQYPLGSVSVEPHNSLSLISNEELGFNSDVLPSESEHQILNSEKVINGSVVDIQNRETDELILADLQESEPSEEGKSTEELAAPKVKVNPIAADVIVETFPLWPDNKLTDNWDGKSGASATFEGKEMEILDLELELEEKETYKLESGSTDESYVMEGAAFPENLGIADQKVMVSLADPLVENNSHSVHNEAVENLIYDPLEVKKHSIPKENCVHDTLGEPNLKVKGSRNVLYETHEQRKVIPVNKAVQEKPNDVHAKNLGDTFTSNPSLDLVRETAINENKANDQFSSMSRAGSNPTLDRINLESWEGVSKKSEESQNPSILAIFKAFVTAFVKFWSE